MTPNEEIKWALDQCHAGNIDAIIRSAEKQKEESSDIQELFAIQCAIESLKLKKRELLN